jgi:23S rRNA pseudouridine1911/1915/1917 synthase
MAVRPGGRFARTEWRVHAAAAGIALLEIKLATGRTHQIRVHLKALRHPLVGDPTYGEARWRSLPAAARGALSRFPRPALHAWRLAFAHPATGERVAFEAPLPDDLARLWLAVTGDVPTL